jgi:hypothetical protein
MSNVSTTVATLSRPMGIAKPMRWEEKHSQAPLAGIDRSSPEATGGEDGGQRGRLGYLVMEAKKASICSFFQVTFTPSPLSPYRRGRPHCSPTCPGCRQVCNFSCSSECHQSSPKAQAHRGASTGYSQHHQVGTTSDGRAGVNQATRTI